MARKYDKDPEMQLKSSRRFVGSTRTARARLRSGTATCWRRSCDLSQPCACFVAMPRNLDKDIQRSTSNSRTKNWLALSIPKALIASRKSCDVHVILAAASQTTGTGSIDPPSLGLTPFDLGYPVREFGTHLA